MNTVTTYDSAVLTVSTKIFGDSIVPNTKCRNPQHGEGIRGFGLIVGRLLPHASSLLEQDGIAFDDGEDPPVLDFRSLGRLQTQPQGEREAICTLLSTRRTFLELSHTAFYRKFDTWQPGRCYDSLVYSYRMSALLCRDANPLCALKSSEITLVRYALNLKIAHVSH